MKGLSFGLADSKGQEIRAEGYSRVRNGIFKDGHLLLEFGPAREPWEGIATVIVFADDVPVGPPYPIANHMPSVVAENTVHIDLDITV